MGEVSAVKVSAGLRVGFWDPRGTPYNGGPFKAMGYYCGPDLGDLIPGARLQQQLIEGLLEFSVGVLFRPDLGKRQRLETILILDHYIPEMWDYNEHWTREFSEVMTK